MLRPISIFVALVVSVAGAINAQNNVAVFPSDHTGTGGALTKPGYSSQSTFPFSWGVARQMALYESWDLKVPNGALITHVGFPCDENLISTGVRIQLEVFMGSSVLDVKTASSTYSSNYTGPRVNVFAKKVVNLPNLGAPAQEVVWLPLDTPFSYDATRNLVVEYVVDANANGNAPFPYYLDLGRFRSEVRSFGKACVTSGGRTPALGSQPTAIGDYWQLYLSGAPASTPMFVLFAARSYEPGIPLDPFGMPGCELLVDVLWSGSYNTSTSGTRSWTFQVPEVRDLVGAKLYTQAGMQDLFANPLGVITSNGDEVQLGLHPLMTVIRNQGDLTQPSGSVSRNWGAISLFGYR